MPPRSKPVPAYRLHKPSGRAVVTVTLPDGRRRDVYLGRFGSPESKAEYERVLVELRAAPPLPAGPAASGLSVNELLLAFLRHADRHYRDPDGKITRELTEYRQCVRVLRELYGRTPAREFGPLALKAVRQKLVETGYCRGLVNRRVGRVKRVFRWAASEELFPAPALAALAAVDGLRKGRSAAREAAPVGPAADAAVAATVPFVRPEVAAMVAVQRLTGMRPGEVCRLRPQDVDRSGPVWLYAPPVHKTAHRGRTRVIAIGPRAQAELAPFWPTDPAEHAFSPKRAVAAMHAARTAARKTPRYPSAANRVQRVAAPKRVPADRYTPLSYGHAVAKGVVRANREYRRHDVPPGEHGPALPSVPHWHPNQLRHAHATAVRRRYGLEAAGATLGHAKLSATEVYAERDLGLAVRVAEETG